MLVRGTLAHAVFRTSVGAEKRGQMCKPAQVPKDEQAGHAVAHGLACLAR